MIYSEQFFFLCFRRLTSFSFPFFLKVYNDDLDEDNSDYVEEGEGEEDDDIDSDEDEANESATGQPQEPAAGLFFCSFVFLLFRSQIYRRLSTNEF